MLWQAFVQLSQQLFLKESWNLATLKVDLHTLFFQPKSNLNWLVLADTETQNTRFMTQSRRQCLEVCLAPRLHPAWPQSVVWRNPGLAAQLDPLSQNLSCIMAISVAAVEGTGWPGNFLKEIAQGNIGIVCSQLTGILPPAEVAACTPLIAVSKGIQPPHP